MLNRDLKNRINEAFESDMPDLRSRILASCEEEEQLPATEYQPEAVKAPAKVPDRNLIFKWAAACAACLVIFISGLLVGLSVPDAPQVIPPAETASFVYLDVNPSIELRMDDENKVLKCLAANEDAEALLADLQLCGVDMKTAITALSGALYVNGYISEESNSILISVDAGDDESTNALISEITVKINDVFEKSALECSVIAQSVKINDELKQRAEENGVSVGKMHFVDKMVSEMDDLDDKEISDLVNMSIKDLNSIYHGKPDEKPGDDIPGDDTPGDDTPDNDKPGDDTPVDDTPGSDDSLGDELTEIERRGVLTYLMWILEMDVSDVESYDVHLKNGENENDGHHIYVVSLKMNGDDTVYEYEVNSHTGKVTEINGSSQDDNASHRQNDND